MNQLPDWRQFSDSEFLKWRGGQVTLRKDLNKTPMSFPVSPLQFFPGGTYKGNCKLHERKHSEFLVCWILALNWQWFWKTSRNLVILYWNRGYGGKIINGVLTDILLTVGSVGYWTHPMVIFLVQEYIIGVDILRIWQNSHIGSLTWEWGLLGLKRLNGSHLSCLYKGK